MSHWCPTHPRYSARRAPNSICGECWALYFYRHPEKKPAFATVTEEDIEWAEERLKVMDKNTYTDG